MSRTPSDGGTSGADPSQWANMERRVRIDREACNILQVRESRSQYALLQHHKVDKR